MATCLTEKGYFRVPFSLICDLLHELPDPHLAHGAGSYPARGTERWRAPVRTPP